MHENNNQNRTKKIILYALCAAFALIAAAAAVYLLWEKPPALAQSEPAAQPMIHTVEESPAPSPEPTEEPISEQELTTRRQDGVYTVLVAGVDLGGGNTDTIMLGKLDTVRHTLDVVSIPRDTLINVEWQIKKINSVYAGAGEGEEGIAALKSQIRRLTGFDVDCYALVDLTLFTQVVDAIGGVDYDVPIDMDYDIGPVIHLKKGFQHLDGEQALGLMRFRGSYLMGDLDRLDVQHDFLKAVAKELVDVGNIPNLRKVLKLFDTGLLTDLETENIAFLIRQALMCKSEDINFYTMPNCPVDLNGYSYVTVEIMAWFDMVNEHLNPFAEPVGFGNVDIVYQDWDGSFHGTLGLRDPDYFPTVEEIAAARKAAQEAAEAESGEETPEEPEEPPDVTPTPEPAETPESEETPEPIGEADIGEAELG